MSGWTNAPAPAPGHSHSEPPKPANPEPTAAPIDPEKHHTNEPEQGKSEHPKQ